MKRFDIAGEPFIVDKRFKIESIIGSGSYGKVCLARDTYSNKEVAIKKIPNVFSHVGDARRILREVKLLRHFRHPNIIRLLDLIEPERPNKFNDLYMVMDYVKADLRRIIDSKNALSEGHIAYIVFQIVYAVAHIHSAQVLHRDLKPGNILINSNCFVKLCDFGLARGYLESETLVDEKSAEMTEYVVSRFYRAPEILALEDTYDYAIDMWSIGCIMAEMFLRKPIFQGEDWLEHIQGIINILGTPNMDEMKFEKTFEEYLRTKDIEVGISFRKIFPMASDDAIDLLQKLLVFNPKKRITAEEALKHKFFYRFNSERVPSFAAKEPFDFSFEKLTRNIDNIRDLMFREIIHYRPMAFKSKLSVKYNKKANSISKAFMKNAVKRRRSL